MPVLRPHSGREADAFRDSRELVSALADTSSADKAGLRASPSNRSFTLTSRLDHPEPRDSIQPALPAAPVKTRLVHKVRPFRAFVAALVVATALLAALSTASPAAAATPCGKKVLDDWFNNGRIDRLYPLNCYEEAIDAIPDDLRDYADAEDVITRALQGALRGDLVPGGVDPTPGDDGSRRVSPSSPVDPGIRDPGDPQAAPEVDTSSTSSVPIPLLVLAGMSLLLLAAGGMGYLSRRRQAAQADDPGPHDPLE